MSINGGCIAGKMTFMESENYVNSDGEHPRHGSVIHAHQLVFEKDQLNNDNWLYIGDATEEEKEGQLGAMRFHRGFVPIL